MFLPPPIAMTSKCLDAPQKGGGTPQRTAILARFSGF